MGPTPLLTYHPKEGVLRNFIALKNQSPRPGLNPRTYGYRGKHTNHYTTEVTYLRLSNSQVLRNTATRGETKRSFLSVPLEA
jgi:hypothetical protein